MIRKVLWRAMTALIILSLTVPSVLAAPDQEPPPPDRERPGDLVAKRGASPEAALEKIAPELRELAQTGGKEPVRVAVEVTAGTDLSAYLSEIVVRPFVFRGNQKVYGEAQASDLLALASMAEVTAIFPKEIDPEKIVRERPFGPDPDVDEAALQARIEALQAIDMPFAEAPAAAVNTEDWFDVRDGHKSSKAWEKGFTGAGVVVGVMDDGIDYGHPDLVGTAARVTDPDSPYYGWPMAYNDDSMFYYFLDVAYGYSFVRDGAAAIWYVDTTETRDVKGNFDGTAKINYTPLERYATPSVEHEYTISATSQSGVAHLGSFPDVHLQNLYGERVAVLVMDEAVAGEYDTVYVDLDNDYDFTDEKPARWGDESLYRDMDGDGYTDISGGMIYWIADGVNPLPIADWMWGLGIAGNNAQDFGEPGAGDLVMFDGAYDSGYSHGTACASNVAAQGVVAGGLSAPSFREGGMVQGAAPDAGLMDFGDIYWSNVDMDAVYAVASLGYDGIAYSGDEVQVATNSYGEFGAYFTNWGYYDRYIADLNHTIGGNTAYVFSYGNDGAGFGTNEGAAGVTTIKVGSSSQYGSTNWDSIASADQIVYGDVTGFASNGPDFDGNVAPDVLANGGRGAGSSAINTTGLYGGVTPFNGWTAWETWGGTSRSAPFAGGNLALIYQAYRDRYGVWPTYEKARTLLMTGATDANADPTLQGAGVVNADRATDLAAGIYGVYATPARWNVGDYRGVDYESFAHMVNPGDVVAQTFTVRNPSGHDITVNLSDGKLRQIGDAVEIEWTSSHLDEESPFNFYSPDYLVPITTTLIPANADLMVVRFVQPLDQYDPDGDYATENHWRHFVYNWTDINGDGVLWEDRDNNGVVNHEDDVAAGLDNDGNFQLDFSDPGTEMQQGEYIRLDYNFSGNTDQLTIRDPLDRMADGLFLGLQHRRSDRDLLPVSGMTFYLEFYERADWPWLSLSDDWLTVEGWGTATFVATMTVPSDAAYGFYDGHILVKDRGDARHDAHTSLLPVGLDVAAELGDDAITFGGSGATTQMYDNNVVRGLGAWEQGGWSILGDWRHFFVDVPNDALGDSSYLLVHSDWGGDVMTDTEEGEWLGTDIDTYILGPYDDGFGAAGDPIFGPYGMEVKGTSRTDNRGGGLWGFSTWTDDTEDWAAIPLEDEGLHEIGLHNGLYDGTSPEVPFEVNVGKVDVGATVSPSGTAELNSVDADVYTNAGQVHVWFTPTIELPNLSASLSGGLVDTLYGPWTVWVPDTGGCYSAWCAGNIYEYFWVPPDQVMLEVYVYSYGYDPDLFLVYDANGNGIAEQGIDPVLIQDGRGSGGNGDEQVFWSDPDSGGYFAVIDGYNTGGGDWLDWQYTLTAIQPLPSQAAWWFDEIIAGTPDDPFDPMDAGYGMTITMTDRISALYVDLYQVTPDVDFDLYVVDEDDEIVARSTDAGTSDESIVLLPEVSNYRFEPGSKYTVLVHGQNLKVGTVVLPTANARLEVGWDVLNMWLTKDGEQASDIGTGEAVSVTVNFEDRTMVQDLGCVQGYLTAGPHDFALLYEKVNACYVSEPPPVVPAWDPDNLTVEYTVETDRGPSPFAPWTIGGVDVPTALGRNWDRAVWTLQVTNNDPTFATPNIDLNADVTDYFGRLDPEFDGFVITPTVGSYGYNPMGPWGQVITWTGSLTVGESFTMSWASIMDPDMAMSDDHLSGVYDGGTLPYFEGACVYFRSFRTTGSEKMADPSLVYPGDTVNYTIALMNPSAEDRNVFVSDELDPALEFVSATNGATYDAANHRVTWGGPLNGSSIMSQTFDIEVTVADTALVGYISNCADVFTKLDDDYVGSYCDSVYVQPSAQVTIDKEVDDIDALGGDTLAYSIVMQNAGPLTATEAILTDMIPMYLTVITDSLWIDQGAGTAMLPADAYDEDDGLLSWEGDLGAGDTYTITFQATITDSAPVEWAIINAAEFTADNAMWKYDSALTEVVGLLSVYMPVVLRD